MFDKCPGAANLRTPTLKIKACPRCGGEIELFSTDKQAACDKCGFVIYSDLQSCIRWCKYAGECLGEELYCKLTGDKGDSSKGGGRDDRE